MTATEEGQPDHHQEALRELAEKDVAELERVGITSKLAEVCRKKNEWFGEGIELGEIKPKIYASLTQELAPDGSTESSTPEFGIKFDESLRKGEDVKFQFGGSFDGSPFGELIGYIDTPGRESLVGVELTDEQRAALESIRDRILPRG